MRAVEPLEALRAKIQPLSKKIFLVTMGSIGDYKARADFSSGFFQVGGFEVISGTGYPDVASAVAAAQASGADAYCICSTDDMYVDLVAPLCKELWGKAIILAGYPKDMVEAYQAQGVDVFIHLRANLHDTLSQISELMEVKK
jgi:methylmalonyl-CoA mutase